ncbi:bifunctional DNA primase/polymerase [Pseudovibrio sp. Alg231-02]|uniref:bifunctional DNA primase/polymerase n=1 Tax=Pseudovibrio sp. Alg231-02 TaxID=1922223 RepID=UPI000D54D146|nr:bifunctional DNA primase/polymerase [Pseudovibrio sp. Alg231-02]
MGAALQYQANQLNIFQEHGPRLAELGLCVIPLGGEDGKKPLVQGFDKLEAPYSIEAIVGWAEGAFRNANVGIVTGWPSQVFVVDVDDSSLVPEMLNRYGEARLVTSTPSGGFHLWYRYNGEACGDLRSEGLGVDLKGKGGIIVVPPSARPDLGGKQYRLEKGRWEELAHLTKAKPQIPQIQDNDNDPTVQPTAGAIRKGRRNKTLHREALKLARGCSSLEELLAAVNQNIAHRLETDASRPFPEREIVRAVKSAWKYEEQGTNFANVGGISLTGDVIDRLNHNANALQLYIHLRRSHGASRKQFSVSPKAMATNKVLPGWNHQRYRSARDWLTENCFLKLIHKGGRKKGDADMFVFTDGT